jgi:hypothetical protein
MFIATAKNSFADTPFADVKVPEATTANSSSDDDGNSGPFRVQALMQYRLKVKSSATNDQLSAVVAGLRRAEKELPDREEGSTECPDAFVDFHIDTCDGDRFLVITAGMADADPILQSLSHRSNPAAALVGADAHATLLRHARVRFELPVTASEWLESDKSWPSILNCARASFEGCGNRSNVDQILLLLSALFTSLGPDFASQQLRSLSLARLATAAEADITFNPPSLVIGKTHRSVTRRHAAMKLAEQNVASMTRPEDAAAAKTMLGTTAHAELWSRHVTSELMLPITGSLAKDLIVKQLVTIYAEQNEYNDEPEEEEAFFVPAIFAAAGVLDELTSVMIATPMFRTDVAVTGFDLPKALPKSMSEAAAQARQFIVSFRKGKGAAKDDEDDGSGDDSAESDVDFDDDDFDDNDACRPSKVVRFEKHIFDRFAGRNRLDGMAIVSRFAPRSTVRIAVLSKPDDNAADGLNKVLALLGSIGFPVEDMSRFKRFSAIEPVFAAASPFTATIDGVRVQVVVTTNNAFLQQAHAVIVASEPSVDVPIAKLDVVVGLPDVSNVSKVATEASVTIVDTAADAIKTAIDNLPAEIVDAARRKAVHPLDF